MMKTVWMIGAGFSKQGGYPIVSDFLNPTYFVHWLLREELLKDSHHQAAVIMPQIEHWTKMGDDLNRLMSQFLDEGDFTNTRKLNEFILRTLERVCLYHRDVHHMPYLQAFVNIIAATNSTIISFNYDTLIEEKICQIHGEFYLNEKKIIPPAPYNLGLDTEFCQSLSNSRDFMDYGSGFMPFKLPSEGDFKILKVHGSTFLWYCHECLTAIYRVPTEPGPATHFYCPRCQNDTEQDLMFVPPASDRTFSAWKSLESLWTQAEEELGEAQNLIVIGYSLPTEDETAKKLLKQTVSRNPFLRILVVDPYLGETQQNRFQEIFPEALFLRESCETFMGLLTSLKTKFRNLVLKDMDPKVGAFLSDVVSPAAARTGGALPGFMPIESDPFDHILQGKESRSLRQASVSMLGLSPLPDIRDTLYEHAKSSELDQWSRGLIARAIGSIADQKSVDRLCELLYDITPFTIDSPLPGWTPPQTVAAYARAGLLNIAFSNPKLDLTQARVILSALYTKNLLMEHEAMGALTGLMVLNHTHILRTRYTPENTFGLDAARMQKKIYDLRSISGDFNQAQVISVIEGKGFYDFHKNLDGPGCAHDYASPFLEGNAVVIDYASGLMWALGTPFSWNHLCYVGNLETSLQYVTSKPYAGYADWRLPTLEEAMSLLEPTTPDG